jgi:hypothetical protein
VRFGGRFRRRGSPETAGSAKSGTAAGAGAATGRASGTGADGPSTGPPSDPWPDAPTVAPPARGPDPVPAQPVAPGFHIYRPSSASSQTSSPNGDPRHDPDDR